MSVCMCAHLYVCTYVCAYVLQVKLTDEQSTVHVLRRQQVKVLDDQQRWGDNLSQSLEDTEKLRRKYAKARKYYEDKVLFGHFVPT